MRSDRMIRMPVIVGLALGIVGYAAADVIDNSQEFGDAIYGSEHDLDADLSIDDMDGTPAIRGHVRSVLKIQLFNDVEDLKADFAVTHTGSVIKGTNLDGKVKLGSKTLFKGTKSWSGEKKKGMVSDELFDAAKKLSVFGTSTKFRVSVLGDAYSRVKLADGDNNTPGNTSDDTVDTSLEIILEAVGIVTAEPNADIIAPIVSGSLHFGKQTIRIASRRDAANVPVVPHVKGSVKRDAVAITVTAFVNGELEQSTSDPVLLQNDGTFALGEMFLAQSVP